MFRREESRFGVSGVALFRGVSPADFARVGASWSERRYAPGEAIFRAGDPCGALFIVREGIVKLLAAPARGAGTILHLLTPGDVFGELLLSEERRAFTAVAAAGARVTVVSREAFLRLLSAVPAVVLNFLGLLSARLARVEKGLAAAGHTWSYHRLAATLLALCERHGVEVPEGTFLAVRLTHRDLANLIGTTRETVTTQLNRFYRMGLARRRGRGLVVDRRRLEEYVRAGAPAPVEGRQGAGAVRKSA